MLAFFVVLCGAAFAQAGSATFEGDQSKGVAVTDSTNPSSRNVNTVNVLRLTKEISPAAKTIGIYFHNIFGNNVIVNSGSATDDSVSISTKGLYAYGILSVAEGVSSGAVRTDPFLNVPLIGNDPAVPGGQAEVNNYGKIITDGSNAHGIYAYSSSAGYPTAVIDALKGFKDNGFSFEVSTVKDSSGQAVDFNKDKKVTVHGYLMAEDGTPARDDQGKIIEYGTFTIGTDGSYTLQFSDTEKTLNNALESGKNISLGVDYSVLGKRSNVTQSDNGILVAVLRKNDSGVLEQNVSAYFDTFGLSLKPELTTNANIFPDLASYVSGLLADSTAGGIGGGIIVENHGIIETKDIQSHGILSQSIGGTGAAGCGGSIGHSACGGSPGKSPGAVTVIAGGSITTRKNESNGVMALSAGGAGGHGGDGGCWRHGQKGGTGGNGGLVQVYGDGTINTEGNYSSGIVAFSVGGDGGGGGSGSGAMPGGKGGYGGMGGEVIVDGSWNITTIGNQAHGIWAKSLGGNAGNGGSGGWLFGKPGGGGVATDGKHVSITSDGEISTDGLNSYGLYAQSVGGFGGAGGSSWGLFWSFGGNADSGGSGGRVDVVNGVHGKITTNDEFSHAIFAQSIGGGGGSGGGQFSLIASLGGEGASGGNGGYVAVTNDGQIETFKKGSFGIFAQSVGGGGGDGGSVTGLVSIGGKGSQTSDGGEVFVTNNGSITTHEELSHAIFAESVGGGGGNGGRAGGLFSVGGSGGSGGNAKAVTVINNGGLYTYKKESYGIFAQSVGGGGGSGGGAVSLAAGGGVSLGGKGAAGGYGSSVDVTSSNGSSITTIGDRSYGIFAQSVGGGGGDGGFAVTAGLGSVVSVAVGGSAGPGGNASTVDVLMNGAINTTGEESYGIFAQSVGGGGGAGGFGIAGSYGGSAININIGIGGKGGIGGISDIVTVDMNGSIHTKGLRAHGIIAQSVGGGGGEGGFSIAGSIAGGTSVNLSIAGDGGNGNKGNNVIVKNQGSITTDNDDAHGILAQSIGGSGGNGGFSVAASLGGGASLGIGFGGAGGTGSSAGTVDVGSELIPIGGSITTHGIRSYGIFAQSIGGGGGNGGTTITGSLLTPGAISLSFGGNAGSGGEGNDVKIYNNSTIHIYGEQSHGIFAQSIGGGGGAGGLSIAGGVTAFGGLSLAMGGTGGSGNLAGDVAVKNLGSIQTDSEYSYGIFAQSIGGGGGNGGSSGAVMANFSSLIPIPPEYPTGSVNVSLSLGGNAGSGGLGGNVDVDNRGSIKTLGDYSYGILAQSVGGGGGTGGKGVAVTANISAPTDGGGDEKPQTEVKVDFALALGGDGGTGNNAKKVEVTNSGSIETQGLGSHAIFAQSVGGGGGAGGDARSMILSIDPSNWNPSDSPPEPGSISVGATLSLGGSGKAGGNGGEVVVTNYGTIKTHGADSFGIFAQSIGGGGGIGGSGYHGLDWQDFGVPENLEPVMDLLPVQDEGDVHIAVGGTGGASGNGQKVTVTNNGLIETFGSGSIGILAQSVGGGGGIGGNGVTGGDGKVTVGGGGAGGASGNGGAIDVEQTGNIITHGTASHGIFAQSVGGGGGVGGNADKGISGFGINVAIAADGAKGGNGGQITVNSAGNITTEGKGAIGIYAQSVAGGGGLAGGIDEGFGFAGSAGGTGDSSKVEINHTGNITTYGENAHGIFAQSVGGADYGGEVVVKVNGDISVFGKGAQPVIAQSEGAKGKKNIAVTYEGGTITGGDSSAVGFYEGINNTFTNYGKITTLSGVSGKAIVATNGNDIVNNHGIINGTIDLGAGANAFRNNVGGLINSGTILNVGPNGTVTNEGTFSPLSSGIIGTTHIDGNMDQLLGAFLKLDIDFQSKETDKVIIDGIADLKGQALLNIMNIGKITPGTMVSTILESQNSMIDSVLELVAPQSAMLKFALVNTGHELQLETTMDATPKGLTPEQQSMGQFINMVQEAGSDLFAPFAAELFAMPDVESLGKAYESLSPAVNGLSTGPTLGASGQFTSALVKRMHSVRLAVQSMDAEMDIAQTQPNAIWTEGMGYYAQQKTEAATLGYRTHTAGSVFGYDRILSEGLLAGISGGYSDTSINVSNSASSGGIVSSFGSLYGSIFNEKWYVDFATAYGTPRYDNYREVTVGALTGLVHSKHSGDLYSGYIESGFNFLSHSCLLQPYSSVRYTSLTEGSYDESGMPGVNLSVERKRIESVILDMGLRFSHPIKTKQWVFLPEAQIAWDHDFDVDTNRLVAAFDSAPSLKFETDSPDVRKDGLILGLGVTAINKKHFSLSLNYKGEIRNGYTAHALTGGMRVEF